VPTSHIVEQGEHLSSIALKYGFYNYKTVWLDESNAGLRQIRKDPNVLFPGDVVMIPERTIKSVDAPTTNLHVFRVFNSALKLRIVLLRFWNRPIGSTKVVLNISGSSDFLSSDVNGLITDDISAREEKAELNVIGLRVQVRIGHLDPIETPSGQLARLTNLGYYLGATVGGVDLIEVRSAVEEFQCDNLLTVDGVCGPQTQTVLEKEHGS
jgi:hypothetical protein